MAKVKKNKPKKTKNVGRWGDDGAGEYYIGPRLHVLERRYGGRFVPGSTVRVKVESHYVDEQEKLVAVAAGRPMGHLSYDVLFYLATGYPVYLWREIRSATRRGHPLHSVVLGYLNRVAAAIESQPPTWRWSFSQAPSKDGSPESGTDDADLRRVVDFQRLGREMGKDAAAAAQVGLPVTSCYRLRRKVLGEIQSRLSDMK